MKKICKSCNELKEHYGKGLCIKCYDKKWYRENKNKVLEKNKKWYKQNIEKIKEYYQKHKEKYNTYGKTYRDKKRRELFERLGNKCIICGFGNNLIIHHKDNNRKNNNPNNLVVLCWFCHKTLHNFIKNRDKFLKLTYVKSCMLVNAEKNLTYVINQKKEGYR